MKVIFIEDDYVEESELEHFYERAGKTEYLTEGTVKLLLENSLSYITVRSDHKLVGLLRMVGDGVSVIFIKDMLLLKEFQKAEVAHELLEHAFNLYPKVTEIAVITEDNEQHRTFFESIGLKRLDCEHKICYIKK